MGETTAQTRAIILNIVVKDFGNLFQKMKIYILKSLNLLHIRQKKKMTVLQNHILK